MATSIQPPSDPQDRRPNDQAAALAAAGYAGMQISEKQYRDLVTRVYNLCGIDLGDHKRELLKARLAKRLRVLQMTDLKQYLQLLENDQSGQELVNFLDVITTNKTDFFREPQHFDFLAKEALPELEAICRPNENVRIWSAACSSGEEPYTLSIVLSENKTLLGGRQAGILASDLSTKVLDRAKKGIYAKERVGPVPNSILTRYFQRGSNRWQGHVRVKPQLRSMITFKRINLMDDFHFKLPFHYIFCRNVMIYFDKATVERLVGKFHQCLVPGGLLFVGHSESLAGINHAFKFVKPAIYLKGA